MFASEQPALRALAKRVKESFDPKGILNPGRMWAGV
ncbi:MAG: FAD-linked oxidase C-terminal domain-containing protein [Pseudolabrys sp.]